MNEELIKTFEGENGSINTTIICSTKYDLIKPFKNNRYGGYESQLEYTTEDEIEKFNSHVNDIKNSMIQFGSLRGHSEGLFDPREPIIVFNINGEFYNGDGQHRLEAARRLGIPFYMLVIESPYGVYDEETKTMRMDSNDEEFASEYFLRMNKEMQQRWSAQSKISSSARDNNYMAQYICNVCNKNPFFKSNTLNNRMVFNCAKLNKKTKEMDRKNLKAIDCFNELGLNGSSELTKQMTDYIDEYVSLVTQFANAFYENEEFGRKSEKAKKAWLKNLYNNKYFNRSIVWIMNNLEYARKMRFTSWESSLNYIKQNKTKFGKWHYGKQTVLPLLGVCCDIERDTLSDKNYKQL